MQPAITRSSVELGGGAVKVLRCSSLRSDPADAGPADLDGASAQLRFGNYVMAGLCATLPSRWLSLTRFRAALFCGHLAGVTRHPLRIARRACGARSRRRSQSPNRTPRTTHRAVRCSTKRSDINQHTGRAQRRVVPVTSRRRALRVFDGRVNTSRHG